MSANLSAPPDSRTLGESFVDSRAAHTLNKFETLGKLAEKLQPLPVVLTRLAGTLEKGDCDLSSIADLIRMDPVLSLKLLKTANSAFSAGAIEVSTIEAAVLRLGLGLISTMAYAISVNKDMKTDLPAYNLAPGELWRHSAEAAVAAENLVRISPHLIPPATVTAALLHDVGKLVIAQSASLEDMDRVRRARKDSGLSLQDAEMEILEMNHGEVGYIVAQQWGLPERISRAIMFHHTPELEDDRMCDAVYIAVLTAHAASKSADPESNVTEPAPEVIERLELHHFDFKTFTADCGRRFAKFRAFYGA